MVYWKELVYHWWVNHLPIYCPTLHTCLRRNMYLTSSALCFPPAIFSFASFSSLSATTRQSRQNNPMVLLMGRLHLPHHLLRTREVQLLGMSVGTLGFLATAHKALSDTRSKTVRRSCGSKSHTPAPRDCGSKSHTVSPRDNGYESQTVLFCPCA